MKKISCAVLALLLAACVLAGCAAASADGVYGKDDANITVGEGETFVIQLDANPTTGYDWSVKISDESIVMLESQEYKQQPGTEDRVGAGGADYFTFKGLKTGSTTLTLIYERSFEEGSASETLVFNVTVQ